MQSSANTMIYEIAKLLKNTANKNYKLDLFLRISEKVCILLDFIGIFQ